jgi:hypothetical protein
MTKQPDDSLVLRRHFIALATSEYDDSNWRKLPVQEEVRVMHEWLCNPLLGPRRFTFRFPSLANNPSLREIHERLNPVGGLPWNESDVAVIFVTGHGETSDRGLTHWTVLKTTEPGRRLPATALRRTADLIAWLAATDVQHLFLILDMCFAGAIAAQTVIFDADIPPNWLVLPSATRDVEAIPGALTTAISEFLADLESPLGRRHAGKETPYLNVETFLIEVQQRLSRAAGLLVPLQGSQTSGPHLCLPNPYYQPDRRIAVEPARRDLALPREELLLHWSPRARGVAREEESGWFFQGRELLMEALIETATGSPNVTLVTGCAGSGKSAVLARLATLSDPYFRAAYPKELSLVPAKLDPGVNAVDVAVLATGKTPVEVAAQLCRALGIDEPSTSRAVATTEEWLGVWHAWLREHKTSVTVIIDALDEAENPFDVLVQVLACLAAGDSRHRVRLLIGVRSPRREDTSDPPVTNRVRPLADRAEELLGARRIPVDQAPWWNPQDITAYAKQVLLATPGSPYAESTDPATTISVKIAVRAGTSFLIARLAASSLAHRTSVVGVGDASWLAAVDGGVTGVFRDDLWTTLPREEDRVRAVHLLRAVSLARGRGLPWARIWPAVTGCVVTDKSRSYGDADIAWLLDSRIGAYLVTDVEDGATVYRLFHDALRIMLRDDWQDLLNADDAEAGRRSYVQEMAEVQRSITGAFLTLADESLTYGMPPPAYIRRYVALHAHAGGVLDGRIINTRTLPYLDVSRLWQLDGLQEKLTGPEDLLLNALRGVAFSWDYDNPAVNAAGLALALVDHGIPIEELTARLEWHPDWANWAPTAMVPLGSWGPVTTILPDGRIVAIVAELKHHEPVIYDLASGQTTGALMQGRPVGCVRLSSGRVVVLLQAFRGQVTYERSEVDIRDLSTRAQIATIPGHMVAIAVLPDGRPIAVVTTRTEDRDPQTRVWHRDPQARVWDLDNMRPTDTVMEGEVIATLTAPGEHPLIILSADTPSPQLQVRDLETGALLRVLPDDIDLERGRACIVTVGPDELKRFVIVYREQDDTRAWDVLSGQREEQLLIADILDAAATAPLPGGGTAIVLADAGWQVFDGRDSKMLEHIPVSSLRPVLHISTPYISGRYSHIPSHTRPFPGHMHQCDTVGGIGPFLRLPDGREIAVTENYGSSFIRDLRYVGPSQKQSVRPFGEPSGTGALRDGHKIMLSPNSETGLIHVLDLRTGEEFGRPFDGHARHDGYANDAKAAVLRTGRRVVISGGDDGAWLWDLDTREPIKKLYSHRKHGVGEVGVATTRDGRVLGVVGSLRARVAVYDLETAKPVGSTLWPWPLESASDYSITAIATTIDSQGTPIGIISNMPDKATVFNLNTNDRVRLLKLDHPLTWNRSAIAAASTATGEVYALLGVEVWNPSIDRWNARDTRRIGLLQVDPADVQAVSMASLISGEVVAFTVSTDGCIRAFAIPSGRQIGSPLTTLGKACKLNAEPGDAGSCSLILYGRYGWAHVTWTPPTHHGGPLARATVE